MSLPTYASRNPRVVGEERVSSSQIWRVGLLAIVLAAVANTVVWAVATAAFDIPDDFMPLASVWPAIVFTVLVLAVGLGVFVLLVRRSPRPITWFLRIAVITFLLSFLTLIGAREQDGATTAGILTLGVMHVVAFAVFVPLTVTRTRAA